MVTGRFAAIGIKGLGKVGQLFKQGMANQGLKRMATSEADELIELVRKSKVDDLVAAGKYSPSAVADVNRKYSDPTKIAGLRNNYQGHRMADVEVPVFTDKDILGKLSYAAGEQASRIGNAAKSLAAPALMLAPEIILYSAMMGNSSPVTGQDITAYQPGMPEQEAYLRQMQIQSGLQSYPDYQSY